MKVSKFKRVFLVVLFLVIVLFLVFINFFDFSNFFVNDNSLNNNLADSNSFGNSSNDVLIDSDIEKKQPVSFNLVATGDILCHNTQYFDAYNSYNGTYDFNYVFDDVKKYIEPADITLCSLVITLGLILLIA